MRRRVVVTGAGVVSSIGTGVQGFWDALAEGGSGAARVEVPYVGEITAYPVTNGEDSRERFGQREARRMDRAGRFAAVAGSLAMEDAGELGLDPTRIGASVGSAHAGADVLFEAHRVLAERGADRVSPLTSPLSLANAPCAATARSLGLRGPSAAPSTACAAGADGIGIALMMIRDGRADAMLAGGAEAPISPMVVVGYGQVGALSRGARPALQASRPFDVLRDGFVMGEGAGLLLLEEREHALARGARVYAELSGYGISCDANHLTDPDPSGEGPARAMRMALADAGIGPEAIGYVNAHATSTVAGDLAESRGLGMAGLGEAPVSSTKAAHGHILGGAGGVEAVATLMAFARGTLPPTLNLIEPDPAAPLDHVTSARAATIDAALSNSFGFGGHNSSLVFVRHEAP